MSQKTSKTPQEKKMKHISFKLKASTIIIMGIFMGGNVYADTSSTSLWDGLSGAYKEAKRGISKTADQVSQAIESAKNTVINAISKNQEESQKIAAKEAQNTQKAQQTSIVTFTQGLADEEKKRREEQALKDQQKQEAANQYNANNGGGTGGASGGGGEGSLRNTYAPNGPDNPKLTNVQLPTTNSFDGPNEQIFNLIAQVPVRRISSGTPNAASNFKRRVREGKTSYHGALDIGTAEKDRRANGQKSGVAVLAAFDGVVTNVSEPTNPKAGKPGHGYWYHVTLSHDGKFSTFYGHMDFKPDVQVGQYVRKGQQIGWVGGGGDYPRQYAYHLHFEIWYGPGQSMVLIDPQLITNRYSSEGFKHAYAKGVDMVDYKNAPPAKTPVYTPQIEKFANLSNGNINCAVKPTLLTMPAVENYTDEWKKKLVDNGWSGLIECVNKDPFSNIRNKPGLYKRALDVKPGWQSHVPSLSKRELKNVSSGNVSSGGYTSTVPSDNEENLPSSDGMDEARVIENPTSYKNYDEYLKQNRDKPIVWVGDNGKIFATPAYNSKYGAGGNGTGKPSFIIPMGNVQDYSPTKLEEAGCAPGVWGSMYETYLDNARAQLEVGLQTQVDDQIASTPPLAQDCFANIMEALERLRKAYEKAADIINGNFKITIDWEALYKMARERAIEFACKVINEKIINGVLPWDTITYFINTADTVGNITNVINSQVGADVIIHQENPNATKTNTGNGSSDDSTK